VEVQKNPDYEMRKEQILSGTGEDPDKPKIFVKKNVRNHSYYQFYLVSAKIRINRGLLYFPKLFLNELPPPRRCRPG